MSKPSPECSTGKRRWTSMRSARDALDRILEQPLTQDRMYQPTRVIRCLKCRGFHLTSRDGKPWKHGKRRDL
jgi:hypothetical protein